MPPVAHTPLAMVCRNGTETNQQVQAAE